VGARGRTTDDRGELQVGCDVLDVVAGRRGKFREQIGVWVRWSIHVEDYTQGRGPTTELILNGIRTLSPLRSSCSANTLSMYQVES
jgi:hypothetical protein